MTEEDALAQARRLKAERDERDAIELVTNQLRGIDSHLEDVRLDLTEIDPRGAETLSHVRDTLRVLIDYLRRRVQP